MNSRLSYCSFLVLMLSEDAIELLIYHQPSVKLSLTLRPFGILGYVAGHSLTDVELIIRHEFSPLIATYNFDLVSGLCFYISFI